MSRRELAEAVNTWLWRATGKRYSLDAHTLARYERGAVRWPGEHYRAGLRHVLGVDTDAELGFRVTSTVSGVPSRPTPDLSRFGAEVELGVGAREFVDRIVVDTPSPAGVGWVDVEQVRAITTALAAVENLFGGALAGQAAAGHLRWSAGLVDARAEQVVKEALFEAVGNLAGVVAFSAFDSGDHSAADDCFRFALWCAGRGRSWALRAATLADMARQAAYLGNVDDALSLVELAQVRADRLSGTAQAMLSSLRARLLAQLRRVSEAVAEVDRADAHFAARRPEDDPPWLTYYDDAEHQGTTGRALIPVAIAERDPGHAAERLATAVRLHGSDYPRSRAFSRIRLASLTMSVGDPVEAAVIGGEALDDATSLRSRRVVGELRALDDAARRRADVADVAGLRDGLTAILGER
ncbi:XRE family transcriptional regulator [Saccharothrix xinjiangensis]|uniref:XRE family transcriptional regulator n=1 Tax=Saccharothrix xinjiangensis TaxID=204798 RepID=A0ABV9Y3Z7_9PSEU